MLKKKRERLFKIIFYFNKKIQTSNISKDKKKYCNDLTKYAYKTLKIKVK